MYIFSNPRKKRENKIKKGERTKKENETNGCRAPAAVVVGTGRDVVSLLYPSTYQPTFYDWTSFFFFFFLLLFSSSFFLYLHFLLFSFFFWGGGLAVFSSCFLDSYCCCCCLLLLPFIFIPPSLKLVRSLHLSRARSD
jgi:hypothetical protein